MNDQPDIRPGAILGLLADDNRLRCLSAVVLGAATEADVVRSAGLGPRAVRRALDRLTAGGLVSDARVAGRMRPEITPEVIGATPEQAAAIRGFFDDGRLVSIPVPRGKRLVVLDLLAQQFEPGRVYAETEVNALLSRFHPDYAALRRYLVDEEFLERREGTYWRSGGTFDIG